MKHGDKAKATAKAKASPEKSKAGSGGKSKKVAESSKGQSGKTQSSKGQSRKAATKTPVVKREAAQKSGGKADENGKGKTASRGSAEGFPFTNPLVAAAFKRAVKKFPAAFRRLTD